MKRHTPPPRGIEAAQRRAALFKRAMATTALLGMVSSMAFCAFAGTYYIDNGDITIDGDQITYYEDDKTTQKTETDDDITITQHENVEVTDNTITIKADYGEDVEVTIKDINIEANQDAWYDFTGAEAAIKIEGQGDVTIELDGDNMVKSSHNHAGVEKNDLREEDATDEEKTHTNDDGSLIQGTLTIQDKKNDDGSDKKEDDTDTTGSLTATGGMYGAGIGSRGLNDVDANNIISYDTSNITINGGTIYANGIQNAAGIGGGDQGNASNITINDGTIEAKSVVNTSGGYPQNSAAGAGIGGGQRGNADKITINGGNITAIGGYSGAGIGGGYAAEVTFEDGTWIGVGGDGTNILITGGTVYAQSGVSGSGQGAGIGGGAGSAGGGDGEVTIEDGNVTAIGGANGGAGIGGGAGYSTHEDGTNRLGGTGTVTIRGGTVTAVAGSEEFCNGSEIRTEAEAIGNGRNWEERTEETVKVIGGTVYEEDRSTYNPDAPGEHTHTWGSDESKTNIEPTCTAKGTYYYKCACGATKTEEIAAAHTWGDWQPVEGQEATCTKAGRECRKCTRCESGYEEQDAEPLDHDWKEDENQFVAGTCTENEKHTWYCSRNCGVQNDIRETPNTINTENHNWVEDTSKFVAGTCTENEKHTWYCSRNCGVANDIREIENTATGHNWGEWVQVKAPTTSEEGLEQRVCQNDPGHIETREVARLPEEENSLTALRVYSLTGALLRHEQTMANGCVTFAVSQQEGVLCGGYAALADLKAKGMVELVFRTGSFETRYALDELLARTRPDAAFRLTHQNNTAELSVEA